MNSLINILTKFGLLKKDFYYHLVRASYGNRLSFLGIRNGLSMRRRY